MSTNGIKTYLTDHDIDSLSSETLTTEDKTLVGAINELTEMSSDMTVVDDGDGNIILGADATTIVVPKNSNEIDYDNTESGLIATNVQGAIDEIGASLNTINSNLTKIYSITVSETNTTVGVKQSLKLYRVGNIVFVSNQSNVNVSAATSKTLDLTIPVGYRPVRNIFVSVTAVTGSTFTLGGRAHIGELGNVVYNIAPTGTREFHWNVAYITEDDYPEE